MDPRIHGDGEGEGLADGMEEDAEGRVLIAPREERAEAENEEDLNGGERPPSGLKEEAEDQEEEGGEEEDNLDNAEGDEAGDGIFEACPEIFGEAFPDFGEAGVHAAGDEAGAVLVEEAEAGGFDFASEGDIFDEVVPDFFVAANGLVGGAAEEDELSVGDAEAAVGEGEPLREKEEDENVDEGEDQHFAPASGDLARPEREEIGLFFFHGGEGGSDGIGSVERIGIGEEEEVALGVLGELPAGPRFSGPTFWERSAFEEVEAGFGGHSLGDDVGGLIGGVVVEDDPLEIGVGLGKERIEAGRESKFFVAGGNEDRDF